MATRTSLFALIAASSLGALALFTPGTANAKPIPSCGNIDFSGSENCTFEASATCTGDCDPSKLQVSCSAQLEANCTGSCTGGVQVSCDLQGCEASCSGGCTANPGSFDCEGSCESDCGGQCTTQCSSDSSDANCTSECKASCSTRCQGSCTATPPSGSCDVECQASCNDSCTAQSNLQCDINCQAQGYVSCQSNLASVCQAQCSQPTGALFCNGQYVNAPDPGQCVSDLAAELNINVAATGECSGGTCEGKASASCGQIAPGAFPPAGECVLGIALGAGILGAARRRSKKNAKK
jgi:hypothetical protein